MAVIPTTKALLIVHASHEAELLNFLQEKEIFHITAHGKPRPEGAREGAQTWAELETAIRFLAPHAPVKGGMKNMMIGEKVPSSFHEIEKIGKELDAHEITAKVQELETAQQSIGSEISRLAEEEIFLEEWKEISERSDLSTGRFSAMFCRFPRSEEPSLQDDLGALPEMSHLELLGVTERAVLAFLIFERSEEAAVQRFLAAHEGREISFTRYKGSPKEEYVRLQKEKKEWDAKLQKTIEEILEMAKDLPRIKLLADYYSWKKQKEDAAAKASEMGPVTVFEGWIPTPEFAHLEKELEKRFPEIHLEKLEVSEDEIVPVELKNSKLIKPFEIVTRIFGLPLHHELDPTPYLAPFFLIFFAFCITDAGYGIVVSIATYLMLKLVPMEKSMKEMMQLLFAGGIMTIILGAIFGGWFGIEVQKLPVFLQKLQLFDAINDLQTKVAPLAFGLGILHLWIGVILSGITKVKNGNVSEALQTSFLLAFTLIIGGVWGASKVLEFAPALAQGLQYLFYGLLVFLIWGFGYGTKNIILRPILGILGMLNELMSWFSNILSYSRLFALGMATGIVALVFNTLAITIGEVIPVPGIDIIMIIVILLFGHTLNIALNLLGAFIHSGRLQFIEFFGKFVQGGGGQFSPFQRESRYLFVKAN